MILLLGALISAWTLAGCASRQVAAWSALGALMRADDAVDSAPLLPHHQYLRVTIRGHVILMVLGYLDGVPGSREAVQVWYSADGEVLRLQGGRVAGLTGTPVTWSNVSFPSGLPAWSGTDAGASYVRRYDQMPGYMWNRHERVEVASILPPGDTHLRGLRATSLRWFEERVKGVAAPPPSRYALMPGSAEPVYGEHCCGPSFCLSWQRWPVQAHLGRDRKQS